MTTREAERLKRRVRAARGGFVSMAGSYALGVFNDNFFKQAAMLLAVAAGHKWFQGTATILFALPYLIFGAGAGWLADRFSKGRVIQAAKGLEVLAMTCGCIGILTHSWVLMLAMVFIMGLQSNIFSPSLNGSLPELYPHEYVTHANSTLRVGTTCSILFGVGLAGFVLSIKEPLIMGRPLGEIIVAGGVVLIAIGGFAFSLTVPRRRAAAPDRPFPKGGPIHTLQTLLKMRQDKLLWITTLAMSYVYGAGTLQILLINELSVNELLKGNSLASTMIVTELVGIAIGGLISRRLAKGTHWYRVLAPGLLIMGLAMIPVGLLPLCGTGVMIGVMFPLLLTMGIAGGLILIPCEAFTQIRPKPDRKGSVISASNFAVFTAILLSGPASIGLLYGFIPSGAFAMTGLLTLGASLCLIFAIPAGPGNLFDMLVVGFFRIFLRLRYRVTVKGLDAVTARGTDNILLLPNHPALLVDPLLMLTENFSPFYPRTWAEAAHIDYPLVRKILPRMGVRAVPAAKTGGDSSSHIDRELDGCAEVLEQGQCVLLYPSGHIYRSRTEDLRGNSAAHTLAERVPDTRVVLIRTTGLWGSDFTYAKGHAPQTIPLIISSIKRLLLNGILFSPRRKITIEYYEPDDLPRDAGRDAFNGFIESWYHEDEPPNTYVPHTIWERGGARELPEPEHVEGIKDTSVVPDSTREIVVAHLKDVSGINSIEDDAHLARDLGLDSLARTELIAWAEGEFGMQAGDPESLQTVGDLLLSACGQAPIGAAAALKPVPAKWFKGLGEPTRLTMPDGETITELFLHQAKRTPNKVIIADQISGVRTYRDVATGIFALRPIVEALEGERVGIMMPASVGADILFLTVLFSGKTPVMVNWTAGARNVEHSLDLVGVKHVLTAKALVGRVASMGTDLSALESRFVYMEDIGRSITLPKKLGALLKARLGLGALKKAAVPEVATILFTSGSESMPKAVPLTHDNILANLRDVVGMVELRGGDRLLGMLPPFHSFGLVGTVIMPFVLGMPTVHHANPTEGAVLAQLIEAYKVSFIIGTPTFLNGIVRGGSEAQLTTLRIAVTGAEKCPDRVYDALTEHCPSLTVIEGYGITECSPIVSANDEANPVRGAIGKIMPSLEYAILNTESNEPVATNEQGMLLVRGPSIFKGYINFDGPSPFVEYDGKDDWYRTGDLVSEDADGVFTFRGRLKRFTKLGGEMISLPAIENVLNAHYTSEDDEGPALAVEATPSEEHPELVLFTTHDVDRQTINANIREAGLSPLHNIRRIIKLDAIPLLGTGKTDYRSLSAILKDEEESS
jgi:acyl-CoA synthetase (AMP-forming)/AMP-acid ligase II/1-acyl-sn-glycerol-3-phosphate acyltransferase/acyl carrier protein